MASAVESEDSGAALSVADQGTSRHICHCGKSFIRKEHLRRHQASHRAGARSYVCHICQRSFNRNDVLRRHVSRHSTAAPPDARRGRACDACFANKTKCSGGDRCSLCTRRGINCTFTREIQGQSMDIMKDPDETTGELVGIPGDGPKPNQAPRMDHEWPDISISNSPAGDAMTSETSPGGINPDRRMRYMTLFRALAKAPAGGQESDAIFQEIDKLAESFQKEEESLTEDTSTPLGIREIAVIRHQWRSLDTVRTLSTTHSKLYFKHFHHRWPIIHAPTFNEETDPFVITASVCMIGAWFEGSKDSRDLALTIHDRLMNYLIQKMITPIVDRRKPFAMPVYQAALLNIIFGLYTGKGQIISRVVILRSLFTAVLREVDFFRADPAHPAKAFRPYVSSLQEGRKRLAFMVFKIDSYLSILRGQPPIIDLNELHFKLSNTFALWNAHGIYMFYQREPEEPRDRERLEFGGVISYPRPFMSSPLLIEDIQLGICNMQSSIWTCAQFRLKGLEVVTTESYSPTSLRERLKLWKSQLDQASALISSQKTSDEPDLPFKAYLGAETTDTPNWRDSVSIRVSSLIFDTTMLYHLLSLQLYANLRALTIVAATNNGPCPLNSVTCASIDEEEDYVREWVFISDARQALLHSVTVVSALTTGLDYDSSLAQRELRDGTSDPITYMAVATSALIAWSYIFYTVELCNCVPDMNYMASGLELVGLEEGLELENWLAKGGLAAIDGVSLCKCNLNLLMGKFAAALPAGERFWEMGGGIAPMLWHVPPSG